MKLAADLRMSAVNLLGDKMKTFVALLAILWLLPVSSAFASSYCVFVINNDQSNPSIVQIPADIADGATAEELKEYCDELLRESIARVKKGRPLGVSLQVTGVAMTINQ